MPPLRFAPPAQPDTQPPTPGFGQQHRRPAGRLEGGGEEDIQRGAQNPEPSLFTASAAAQLFPAEGTEAAVAAEAAEPAAGGEDTVLPAPVAAPAALSTAISDPLPAVGAEADASGQATDEGHSDAVCPAAAGEGPQPFAFYALCRVLDLHKVL